MGNSFRSSGALRQSPIDDVAPAAASTAVDVDHDVLRQVVFDLGCTCESIAAEMGRNGSYKSHVSRVLNGERPMSREFFNRLPRDVRAEYHARQAERLGRVVIPPAVIAFFSALLPPHGQLPMLKASLRKDGE